jgi:hypothetical protein
MKDMLIMIRSAHPRLSINHKQQAEIVKVASKTDSQKALFFSLSNQKKNNNGNEIRFLTSYHEIRLT